MANKIYVMKDDSDKLKQVVVTHGGIQASISGDTIYIGTADATPKQSANFALSPSNITLNAFEPATITASHDGDGIVQIYSDRNHSKF